MNIGKTLFAQLMDFLPWSTFTRIVERHGGDRYVKLLACTDQFRVMAFAQLTYRESLRDIEVCLSAQSAKLYHMGFRHEIKRSTLADANETRDWHIYAEFAQRLIAQARTLYAHDSFGIELENTTYALDSTTIDLCLSLFPWALFRTTKSAVKMHTLLDLRGNIPSFIHISDGKLGDVNVLDVLVLEPGAIYVMDRGYLDFARLYLMHRTQAFFVTRAKSNTRLRRIYSAPVDRNTGIICDQTVALTGTTSHKDYPEYLRRIRFKDPETMQWSRLAFCLQTSHRELEPDLQPANSCYVPVFALIRCFTSAQALVGSAPLSSAFARASKTSACHAGDSRLSGASRQSDSHSASIASSRSAKGSAMSSAVCMMVPVMRSIDEAMVAKKGGVKAYTFGAAISTSADQNETPAPARCAISRSPRAAGSGSGWSPTG
jgi:hypothetical protein